MNIVCLDLEGVLVPEIWIEFAEATGIQELKRTTRDEPDYDKLMNYRLGILREHGLGLAEIQRTIAGMEPMEGAKTFLDELRSKTQVIIVSDTFSQFAQSLLQQVGFETIAAGDSHNDLGMIKASKAGFLFRTTDALKAAHPDIPALETYDELLSAIAENL